MQPSKPSRRQLFRTLIAGCFGCFLGTKATPAATLSTVVPSPPAKGEPPPFFSEAAMTYTDCSLPSACTSEPEPMTLMDTQTYTYAGESPLTDSFQDSRSYCCGEGTDFGTYSTR